MSKPDKSGELKNVDVLAISLVDKAANGEKFKIFKSVDKPAEEKVEKNERGLFSVLKKFFTNEEVQIEKGAVADAVNANHRGEKLVEAFGALMKVLGISRWSDESQNPETDPVKITAAIDDFRNFAIEIMLGQTVEKAGRKISADRLSRLKNIKTLIDEVLNDVNNNEKQEDEPVSKEEISKAITEAIKPLTERIEKLENPEKVENVEKSSITDEDVKKTVTEALEPLTARVEKIEKVRGMSQKIPEDTNVQKSDDDFWGNIF